MKAQVTGDSWGGLSKYTVDLQVQSSLGLGYNLQADMQADMYSAYMHVLLFGELAQPAP